MSRTILSILTVQSISATRHKLFCLVLCKSIKSRGHTLLASNYTVYSRRELIIVDVLVVGQERRHEIFYLCVILHTACNITKGPQTLRSVDPD